ncbi:MAG: 3-oxoacyl-[acyl-carrier-protein] reductase [Thermodesulfobacteriota bacterium]
MNQELASLLSLDGRIALVTGGSRGIGRSICRGLAAAGAFVYVNARSEQDAGATCALIRESGGNAEPLPFDVADSTAADQALARIVAQNGSIDILVNNAGIARDGLVGRMKDSDWDEVIGTNLSGAFRTCRAVSKFMIRKREGRIVNVSSTAGEAGNAGQVNYSASKAGLIGLTKALARELAPRNILVNAVAPGIIQGGMSEHLTQEQLDAIRQHAPLRRMGRPEDVTHAVLFLCSPMAEYITGQVIRVNGGLYM